VQLGFSSNFTSDLVTSVSSVTSAGLCFYKLVFSYFQPEPNAIKYFFLVNTEVFLYLQEKNTDCNAVNTFYLYLQEEFTDKIYRRISPVITGGIL
jgi:hypothetical protein